MNNESPAKFNNSRIVKQLEPSLSHMAAVKIAYILFMKCGVERLETAFSTIQLLPTVQQQYSTVSGESNENNITIRYSGLQVAPAPEIMQQYSTTPDDPTLSADRLNEGPFPISIHSRSGLSHSIPQIQQQYSTASGGCCENNTTLSADRLNEGPFPISIHSQSSVSHSILQTQRQYSTASAECTENIPTLSADRQQEGQFSIPGNSRSCGLHSVPQTQQQCARTSGEWRKINRPRFNTLSDSLTVIPVHLRSCVLHTVRGLNQDFLEYIEEHPYLKRVVSSLRLRVDGTIDRKKMARQIIADVSIDVRIRYHMACMYIISDKIPILWTEMEASGYTENVATNYNPLAFRLPNGSSFPWIQLPPRRNRYPRISEYLRYSSNRSNAVSLIIPFSDDDLLQTMRYVVAKNDERRLLKTQARRILQLHLKWPLQSLFLQTAEKMWGFLGIKCFHALLKELLLLKDLQREGLREDYDYGSLLNGFWNKSPPHLKRSVKKDPQLNRRINLYFGGKRKMETIVDARTNSKRKAES